MPISPEKKAVGGKMKLTCKAFDDAWNTQPRTTAEIWNYRGLNCNSWHTIPVCIQAAPRGTATGLMQKAGHGLMEKAEQGMKALGVA